MKTITLTIVLTLAFFSSYSQCEINKEVSKKVFTQINELREKIGKEKLTWSDRSFAKASKKVCKHFIQDIRKVYCAMPIENLAYTLFNQNKYDWGIEGAIAVISYRGEYYFILIVE